MMIFIDGIYRYNLGKAVTYEPSWFLKTVTWEPSWFFIHGKVFSNILVKNRGG